MLILLSYVVLCHSTSISELFQQLYTNPVQKKQHSPLCPGSKQNSCHAVPSYLSAVFQKCRCKNNQCRHAPVQEILYIHCQHSMTNYLSQSNQNQIAPDQYSSSQKASHKKNCFLPYHFTHIQSSSLRSRLPSFFRRCPFAE